MPAIIQPRRRSRRTLLIIAGIVLVVGLVAGYFTYQKYQQLQSAKENQRIWQEATQLDDHRSYDVEYILLKNYLATNPPHQYQYRVAIQLGTLSINKPDYTAALHWYEQAQSINNGKLEMDAAVGAAIAAANLGRKQEAIDYYRKAIALTDKSPDAPANSGIENYKNSIRALGGTP